MRRLVSAGAFAAVLVLVVSPVPASADVSGLGWSDDGGVGAEAESDGAEASKQPNRRRRSGTKPRCTFLPMPPVSADNAEHMATNGLGPSRGEGPGTWYWKICESGTGMTSGTTVWVPERPEPELVARKALRYTELAQPAIGMSPPPARGAVVHVPLWLWVDDDAWAPAAATASIDGLTITTTATPERVVWSFGNGEELVCEGPGVPYDTGRPEAEQQSDCTFLFQEAGTFTVTATVEWRARWTAIGGAGGGDLGVVRRSASITIPVSEIQALNRPPR